jgi:hypothetical protein
MKRFLYLSIFLGLLTLVSPSNVHAIACNTITNRDNCESSCSNVKADGFTYKCAWRSTDGICRESGQLCGSTGGSGVTCTTSTQGYNPNLQPQCCVPGGTTSYDPVTGQPYQGTHWTTCTPGYTCNQGYGCFADTSTPPPSPSTGTCQPLYYCNTSTYECKTTSNPYDTGSQVQCDGTRTNTCSQNLQIYLSSSVLPGASCYTTQAGCLAGCVRPTPTPGPVTGMCLNVKPYNVSTWTEMTRDQVSNLVASQKMYFCVKGGITGSTSGSFDLGQFTINGILQSVTSTRRPGTTDEFCQLYTIPTGTYRFQVYGAIRHTVLGWFRN